MWLDERLTWRHHIEHAETKCKKVLNLMRMITGQCWGADGKSLMYIYTALIRSFIDYGCVIYSSACKTSLRKLERVQFKAIRIALGAIKTTPTSVFLVESEEYLLSLRYIKLSLTYWVRLMGSINNPAISVLNDCWEYHTESKGFGWNINSIAEQYRIKEFKFSPSLVLSAVPTWFLPSPEVNSELLKEKKEYPNEQSFAAYCQRYLETSFYGYVKIYTDGSKDPQNGHCGIGIYVPEFNKREGYRLNNFLSVYSIEMTGLITALRWIGEVKTLRNVICTDSMAALHSLITGHSSREDLIIEIKYLLLQLKNLGISIQFCWVPAHIGIKGNAEVDNIAKKMLENKKYRN